MDPHRLDAAAKVACDNVNADWGNHVEAQHQWDDLPRLDVRVSESSRNFCRNHVLWILKAAGVEV